MVTIGTEEQIQENFRLVVLLWSSLGVPLSFVKGQTGNVVKWIGANITVSDDSVEERITESRMNEFAAFVDNLLGQDCISLKSFVLCVGKAQSIVGVLHTWWPFLNMLYAVIHDSRPSGCPQGCRWLNQIELPLRYFKTFLFSNPCAFVRTYFVEQHFNVAPAVIIGLDASPVGFGAWVMVDGHVTHFFVDELSKLDRQKLGVEGVEGADLQQVSDFFTVLVSLRAWRHLSKNKRVVLTLRGDNIAALTMCPNMQPRSNPLSIIAHEVALDIAESLHHPDVLEHVLGVSNSAADYLSIPERW